MEPLKAIISSLFHKSFIFYKSDGGQCRSNFRSYIWFGLVVAIKTLFPDVTGKFAECGRNGSNCAGEVDSYADFVSLTGKKFSDIFAIKIVVVSCIEIAIDFGSCSGR